MDVVCNRSAVICINDDNCMGGGYYYETSMTMEYDVVVRAF